MSFNASSTDIVSSIASSRGTNTVKPDATFALFGTNTVTRSWRVTAWISGTASDVCRPIR